MIALAASGAVLALLVAWLLVSLERRRHVAIEQLAERLRHLNSTLEERLSAHTAQLEVAVELAETANRAKSEFLANMSHEIRTPLNAVIGLTEVVLGTELTEFQRDHLRTVLDSGDALLNVINEVLDFSKIEAGKMTIERVPFRLEDAVCDALKPLAIRAQSKGLELTCLVDPAAPRTLIGDPGRLRQVITNLVNNGITYTERGEVFVRVTFQAATSQLQVAVLDSGIGIDPTQLARVFEAFQQADSSTTRRFGGTGLGLAICRELVGLMGGEIRAESEPGVGSTFSFTLTCEVPAQCSDAQARAARLTEALVDTRILIVDDNMTNRTILSTLARAQGMRPVSASSPEEAFAVLGVAKDREDPVAVVVLDVHMADSDGFSLAERIRRHPEFDDLAIVLLTSAVADADVERCDGLRVAARLMKPVKQSELIEAVALALGQRGSPGAPVPGPVSSPDRARDARAAPEPAPASAVQRRRILLVEDSAPNRKLALAILGADGHSVAIAENGRSAVEACGREDFDVVLMDVQMPEMDGLEATAAIRRAEKATGRHVPIIAMTAHALRGDRERCLEVGMDDYVSKPIRRGDLQRALNRVAGPKRAIVDWSAPLAQVDGNREVLREIVQAYLNELRENLELLPRAIKEEDWQEVRRRAHTVKGAMRMFGASEAQALGQKLETQADCQTDAQSAAGAIDLFRRLEASVDLVLPELAFFAETGSTDPNGSGGR